MPSREQICNLGLSKISAFRVSSLSPPKSAVEQECAAGYELWKQQELVKKRWVFARKREAQTYSSVDNTREDGRIYVYEVPADCLRPIQPNETAHRFTPEGTKLYSRNSALILEYIFNVDDSLLVPLFVDVLACRVAIEEAEPRTQSNQKKEFAQGLYNTAIAVAGALNAYITEPETHDAPDEAFSWLNARLGYPP